MLLIRCFKNNPAFETRDWFNDYYVEPNGAVSYWFAQELAQAFVNWEHSWLHTNTYNNGTLIIDLEQKGSDLKQGCWFIGPRNPESYQGAGGEVAPLRTALILSCDIGLRKPKLSRWYGACGVSEVRINGELQGLLNVIQKQDLIRGTRGFHLTRLGIDFGVQVGPPPTWQLYGSRQVGEIYVNNVSLSNDIRKQFSLEKTESLAAYDRVRGACFICALRYQEMLSWYMTDTEPYYPYENMLFTTQILGTVAGTCQWIVESFLDKENNKNGQNEPYYLPRFGPTKADIVGMATKAQTEALFTLQEGLKEITPHPDPAGQGQYIYKFELRKLLDFVESVLPTLNALLFFDYWNPMYPTDGHPRGGYLPGHPELNPGELIA